MIGHTRVLCGLWCAVNTGSKRVDKELSVSVKRRVNSFPDVLGCYDLILHNYGPEENLGSLHIEVADDMTARQIDELTRNITYAIYSEFGIVLTIGIYAQNIQSEKAAEIRSRLVELIKEQKTVIGMHGFYIDEIRNAVSFDLIFDFEEKDPGSAAEHIKAVLSEENHGFTFNVNIDRDYSD